VHGKKSIVKNIEQNYSSFRYENKLSQKNINFIFLKFIEEGKGNFILCIWRKLIIFETLLEKLPAFHAWHAGLTIEFVAHFMILLYRARTILLTKNNSRGHKSQVSFASISPVSDVTIRPGLCGYWRSLRRVNHRCNRIRAELLCNWVLYRASHNSKR